jgi:hypothetical protein
MARNLYIYSMARKVVKYDDIVYSPVIAILYLVTDKNYEVINTSTIIVDLKTRRTIPACNSSPKKLVSEV